MAVALRRSLPAILASAGTVSVGMMCLLAARMNDMHSFGPIAAAGIIVALTVMMTLLPALLVVLGRWVFWPFVPRFGTAALVRSRPGIWDRLARVVGRRPRLIWPVTALGLVALSFGVFGLRLGEGWSWPHPARGRAGTGQPSGWFILAAGVTSAA
jgi:RND superfamily putative drug exporter